MRRKKREEKERGKRERKKREEKERGKRERKKREEKERGKRYLGHGPNITVVRGSGPKKS